MKATAKDNANLDTSTQLVDAIEDLGRQIAAARDGIGRVIFGQAQVFDGVDELRGRCRRPAVHIDGKPENTGIACVFNHA